MSAIISDCGKYRYELSRVITDKKEDPTSVTFVMLNPSTADASLDDPTIRRCKGFAKTWGYDILYVVNLYSYRATKPEALWLEEDPVGPKNHEYLEYRLSRTDKVVCAWGSNAREHEVSEFRRKYYSDDFPLYCLGKTKAGQPKHPLYIKADKPLDLY